MATKSLTKCVKGGVGKGKLLSVIRSGGEWVAVVSSFRSKANEPVLSHLVPVSELTGNAKRKANRWMEFLA